MSEKTTLNEPGYCSDCGWLDAGNEHNWHKHPDTIHGEYND